MLQYASQEFGIKDTPWVSEHHASLTRDYSSRLCFIQLHFKRPKQMGSHCFPGERCPRGFSLAHSSRVPEPSPAAGLSPSKLPRAGQGKDGDGPETRRNQTDQ